jgi:hypothetical protein
VHHAPSCAWESGEVESGELEGYYFVFLGNGTKKSVKYTTHYFPYNIPDLSQLIGTLS